MFFIWSDCKLILCLVILSHMYVSAILIVLVLNWDYNPRPYLLVLEIHCPVVSVLSFLS